MALYCTWWGLATQTAPGLSRSASSPRDPFSTQMFLLICSACPSVHMQALTSWGWERGCRRRCLWPSCWSKKGTPFPDSHKGAEWAPWTASCLRRPDETGAGSCIDFLLCVLHCLFPWRTGSFKKFPLGTFVCLVSDLLHSSNLTPPSRTLTWLCVGLVHPHPLLVDVAHACSHKLLLLEAPTHQDWWWCCGRHHSSGATTSLWRMMKVLWFCKVLVARRDVHENSLFYLLMFQPLKLCVCRQEPSGSTWIPANSFLSGFPVSGPNTFQSILYCQNFLSKILTWSCLFSLSILSLNPVAFRIESSSLVWYSGAFVPTCLFCAITHINSWPQPCPPTYGMRSSLASPSLHTPSPLSVLFCLMNS